MTRDTLGLPMAVIGVASVEPLKANARVLHDATPMKVAGGKIRVRTGPGLGGDIDPDFSRKHRPGTL